MLLDGVSLRLCFKDLSLDKLTKYIMHSREESSLYEVNQTPTQVENHYTPQTIQRENDTLPIPNMK